MCSVVFFFNVTATTEIYTYLHTLSLHDALPISSQRDHSSAEASPGAPSPASPTGAPPDSTIASSPLSSSASSRSEEHTSELQSLMRISYAVFCLKKKKIEANTQIKLQH